MLSKYLYGTLAFALAFGVLFVSLLKLSTITYAFNNPASPTPIATQSVPNINYPITLPGSILQDSILWPLKAVRDRVWYLLTWGHLERAQLALFFSDKRTVSGESLLKNNKADLAVSSITKGGKYLEIAVSEEEQARKEGMNTSAFLNKLATASLKHREIIESILPLAPDEARPSLSKVNDGAKNVYQNAATDLREMGKTPPKNPFEGQ